jgi:para-nitrobenzyl esterase
MWLQTMRSEADFIRPAFTFADSQIAWKQPQTYFYHFDWQSPLPELGAGHCLDLPFLFGNPGEWAAAPMLQGANQCELEALTERFQQALSAFVYTGNPTAKTYCPGPAIRSSAPSCILISG